MRGTKQRRKGKGGTRRGGGGARRKKARYLYTALHQELVRQSAVKFRRNIGFPINETKEG